MFLLVLLSACTSVAPPEEPPRSPPPQASPSEQRPEILLTVVASLTGPTAEADRTYLDGIDLASGQVLARDIGGRNVILHLKDDGGELARARTLLRGILQANETTAILVVGDGRPLVSLRREVERFGGPVVLLAGDLYSSRSLYRHVFQTGVPILWQCRAIARYVVRDRRHDRVLLAVEEGAPPVGTEAFESAMAEEGGDVAGRIVVPRGGGLRTVVSATRNADALVFLGGATTAAGLARALRRRGPGPQLVVSADALSPEFADADPPPGTVVPYPYTWAGWAQPIPRVRAFRERFRRENDRVPAGHEQEGYDAVRALVGGLRKTRGRGGPRLVRAMESLPWRPFSSLPVQLGPDDHVFLGQNEVGMFAIPGPNERTESWVGPLTPWRPIMRTFTPDLERTGILDRDKRVFFPRWRRNRPAPQYWKSRYGIVTRPRRDPLH